MQRWVLSDSTIYDIHCSNIEVRLLSKPNCIWLFNSFQFEEPRNKSALMRKLERDLQLLNFLLIFSLNLPHFTLAKALTWIIFLHHLFTLLKHLSNSIKLTWGWTVNHFCICWLFLYFFFSLSNLSLLIDNVCNRCWSVCRLYNWGFAMMWWK